MTDTHSDPNVGTASGPRDGLELPVPRRGDANAPAEATCRLDHVVVEHDGAPDACTIHPVDASTEELRSTWITARGRSFVDLESAR